MFDSKYICVSACMELDSDNTPHCTCDDIDWEFYKYPDGCPVGNYVNYVNQITSVEKGKCICGHPNCTGYFFLQNGPGTPGALVKIKQKLSKTAQVDIVKLNIDRQFVMSERICEYHVRLQNK